MDGWDVVILTCACGFTIAGLVRMMAERRNELMQKRANEVDAFGDEDVSTYEEKSAA